MTPAVREWGTGQTKIAEKLNRRLELNHCRPSRASAVSTRVCLATWVSNGDTTSALPISKIDEYNAFGKRVVVHTSGDS